jgi:hypothetical protein
LLAIEREIGSLITHRRPSQGVCHA